MKVTTMRLYPKPGSLYVRAIVFERRRDLVAFWRACHVTVRARAMCMEVHRIYVRPGHRDRLDPLVATVTILRDDLGAGLVSHEMLHATFAIARRLKLDFLEIGKDGSGVLPSTSPEELMCRWHGNMIAAFWRRLSYVEPTIVKRPHRVPLRRLKQGSTA